jgi:hypothetical protein
MDFAGMVDHFGLPARDRLQPFPRLRRPARSRSRAVAFAARCTAAGSHTSTTTPRAGSAGEDRARSSARSPPTRRPARGSTSCSPDPVLLRAAIEQVAGDIAGAERTAGAGAAQVRVRMDVRRGVAEKLAHMGFAREVR